MAHKDRSPHFARQSRARLMGTAAIALAAMAGSAGASGLKITPVALLNEQVPAKPVGVFWTGFNVPTIDEDGQLWFRADFAGPGGFAQDGRASLWSGTPDGHLRGPVAKQFDATPGWGGPHPEFNYLENIKTDYARLGNGRAAFFGDVRDAFGELDGPGLWVTGQNGLELVVRNRGDVPGVPGGVFNSIGTLNQNISGTAGRNGQFAFRGSFRDDSSIYSQRGIWRWEDGQTSLVVREGDTLPGTNFEVDRLRSSDLQTNSSGALAFEANLTNTSAQLVVGAPDALGVVARPGTPAPGMPSDTLFGAAVGWGGDLNDEGNVLIRNRVQGPNVDPTNNEGIWLGNAQDLTLIARTGDQVPGEPSGTTWGRLVIGQRAERLALGNGDNIAFAANVIDPQGDERDGLWAGTPGNIGAIAEAGQQAPGLPTGIEFASFNEIEINARGQMAFGASLDGVDFGSSNSLWAADTNGLLELVVQEGAPFEVAPGDIREVLSVSTSILGREATILGDGGQLAFFLRFTDGTSGIFHTVIPAPGTLGVLALAGLGVMRRRRPA